MTSPALSVVFALLLGAMLVLSPGSRADPLDPRLEDAIRLYREDGAALALPVLEELAREFARDARSPEHVAALHYVGECHWRLGNFAEARWNLDHALKLQRAAGDRLAEGKTLNVRGLLSWDEGDYARAIEDFKKAMVLAQAVGDKRLEGSSLNNLSLVYDEQGDYDTSLRQYRQVLELYRGIDFPRGVGDTLGNIGGVYLLLGRYREALPYYEQALQISEQLKSTAAMSQDHGNIGLCLLGLGEVDTALRHLDAAVQLAQAAGMRQDQAYWLRVKGNGLVDKGRYDLGLESYRAALAVYEDIDVPAELLETLRDSGQLHLLLGDAASAEHDFRRALDMARSIGLERGITINLISLGDLEFRRKRMDAALALYEEARERATGAGIEHALAMSLLRLARVNRSGQRLEPARRQTEEGLGIARRLGARSLEADALYSSAELARLESRYDVALERYKQAEAAQASIGDPDLLWQIHLGRGRAEEASGQPGAALESYQAAAEVIEGVRGRLEEPRFRSGYVEDKFEVFLELMRLQLKQGRTEDAFATAERLRARSFVEQLRGRVSVPLSARERRREMELRERVLQLQRSLEDTDDEGAPAYPKRALNRFSHELAGAEKAYAAFLDDHARIDVDTGAVPGVALIQQRLSRDQALLEFVVGPDSVTTFVIRSDRIGVTTSALGQPGLVARVALLRDLIRRPGDERWRKPAARLATELLAPLESDGWFEGVNQLYLVPHGVLSYLPFALLPNPNPDAAHAELLVDRYTVTHLPAATALLQDIRGAEGARSLLAVAPSRGRLRHAPEEARAIDALFRPNSRALIGADATESRFKQLAGNFRMLHLATHGYFNRLSPLLSGLEFEPDAEEDGMLRVHEILDLPLQAELVTLSACDTALGTGYFADLPVGEEFVGLNRAFLAAGSESVLATLWRVDDQASVSLMKKFYARLNGADGGSAAASALAQAQRELRRSPQLGHPYYWAAYVVVGQAHRDIDVPRKLAGRKS